jgi:hypothetical protein
MRLFECQCCGQQLYFENTVCERCGHRLGFRPQAFSLIALEAAGDGWIEAKGPAIPLRFCANADDGACNWLVNAEAGETFCLACRHNRMIPDLSDLANLRRWTQIEQAKHRAFYTLLRLSLPLPTRAEDPEGLAFDFQDAPGPGAAPVMTGHDNGLITLNVSEADDDERERRRTQMGEPYRTLLGHMRHELGHFFWDRLVRDDSEALAACRRIFGDEQADYNAALQVHYQRGAPADWQRRFVSSYASAHPWEDFAETFAHYLHIVDTLETAHAFGMAVRPRTQHGGEIGADMDFDPYRASTMERIIEAWLPLAFAVNSLNRSMGQRDLYPFVLSPPAVAKLSYIHALVHPASRAALLQGRSAAA